MNVTFELINGLVFGLEHMQPDDEDDIVAYLIVIHFACFRICLIKLKPD